MLRLGGDHPIGYFLSTGPTGPTGPQRAPTGPFGHAVFAHSLTQETQEQLKTMREKLSEQNDNHQKSLRKLKIENEEILKKERDTILRVDGMKKILF